MNWYYQRVSPQSLEKNASPCLLGAEEAPYLIVNDLKVVAHSLLEWRLSK